MAITNYNDQLDNTPLLEGQIASYAVTPEIFTAVNAGTSVLPFGRLVTAGTDSTTDDINAVLLTGTDASKAIGVTVLTNVNERKEETQDTLGHFGYEPKRPINYLTRGIVGVVVEKDVTLTDVPHYRYRQTDTGTNVGAHEAIGRWRDDADGTGSAAQAVSFGNYARFLDGGKAGDVVPVQFYIF